MLISIATGEISWPDGALDAFISRLCQTEGAPGMAVEAVLRTMVGTGGGLDARERCLLHSLSAILNVSEAEVGVAHSRTPHAHTHAPTGAPM
jgi:hypothetical protein